MERRIIALLPMKANSDRIKGKNFKDLCGKPLYKWILDELLNVDRIDAIVINTDAKDILIKSGLVESDRIIIRDRLPDLCGDLVSMNDVLLDDVEAMDSDIYLMTHTTNPFISSSTINDLIDVFLARPAASDSLFTVNKVQTRFYRQDLTPVNHNPEELVRTQDLEPWFEENSCLYAFTKNSFKKNNARIGDCPMMYQTPPLESIDIDNPHDWMIAEALANRIYPEN